MKESRIWKCCGKFIEWSYDNMIDSGSPVCSECDGDMTPTNNVDENEGGQQCYCGDSGLSVPHYRDDHGDNKVYTLDTTNPLDIPVSSANLQSALDFLLDIAETWYPGYSASDEIAIINDFYKKHLG